MSKISQRGGNSRQREAGPQARRSFSDRARRAAFLHAQGHSRKQIAELIGVAPQEDAVSASQNVSITRVPPSVRALSQKQKTRPLG